jgi:hypothetical protein
MIKIAGSGSASADPFVRGMDPRIRIHTKMSWIRNTASQYLNSFLTELGAWPFKKVPENDALLLATPGNQILEPLGNLAARFHRLGDCLHL